MEVIEQERIRRRFSQAVNTYDDHADAQKRICAHLVQLLTVYTSSHFRRVLEIGCGSGGFTRLLKQECQIEEWVLNDLCETWQSAIEELFPSATPLFLAGDAERLAFPGTFDLIASASALQWMKDLPRFTVQLTVEKIGKYFGADSSSKHIRFVHTFSQKFDFIGFQSGFEGIAFTHNLGWSGFYTFIFFFWQDLFLGDNRICIVFAFLFLQKVQILGKYHKANNDGKIGKSFIIARRFMQICVHIKIRTAENNVLFPLIRV